MKPTRITIRFDTGFTIRGDVEKHPNGDVSILWESGFTSHHTAEQWLMATTLYTASTTAKQAEPDHLSPR